MPGRIEIWRCAGIAGVAAAALLAADGARGGRRRRRPGRSIRAAAQRPRAGDDRTAPRTRGAAVAADPRSAGAIAFRAGRVGRGDGAAAPIAEDRDRRLRQRVGRPPPKRWRRSPASISSAAAISTPNRWRSPPPTCCATGSGHPTRRWRRCWPTGPGLRLRGATTPSPQMGRASGRDRQRERRRAAQ